MIVTLVKRFHLKVTLTEIKNYFSTLYSGFHEFYKIQVSSSFDRFGILTHVTFEK